MNNEIPVEHQSTAEHRDIQRHPARPEDARPEELRDMLTSALLAEDPGAALWALIDSGWADRIAPEIPALRLEQDPIHRHKDVLAHSVAVTAKTRRDLTLRLAALFHHPLIRAWQGHIPPPRSGRRKARQEASEGAELPSGSHSGRG